MSPAPAPAAAPAPVAPADNKDDSSFTFQLALFAIVGAALVGIIADAKHTIRGWSTWPKVVYGITVVLSITLLAVGLMAAGIHAATADGDSSRRAAMLKLSEVCAALSAAFSGAILVVVFCRKLGVDGARGASPRVSRPPPPPPPPLPPSPLSRSGSGATSRSSTAWHTPSSRRATSRSSVAWHTPSSLRSDASDEEQVYVGADKEQD